jgi:NAD(P)H-dependent flavin oxidoreductase YrpB (nitropropane dioxygenase family)
VVEDVRPEVVSFHFGLPEPRLVDRVKAAGCKVISSATTVDEAYWLEKHGADAIIAQGYEAGGHLGIFLDSDRKRAVASQAGTLALVPQVADAVSVPVIAAGGIAAAELGPWSDAAPDCPLPMGELPSLRAAAEQNGSTDFTPLWSGQAAALAREMPAKMLIDILVREAIKFGSG